MGTGVLIDSNIVIDMLAGQPLALREMRAHADRAISIVTWIEVVAGLSEQDVELRQELQRNFTIFPVEGAIAEEASFLRRTTRLKLPDAVILATAHVHQRVLLTRNTRDFAEGRFVRVPYRL